MGRLVWDVVEPGGRWMCGVTALVIGVVRGFSLPTALHGQMINDVVFAAWFMLAAVTLLLTADRPWRKRARVAAAMAAGAFVMLGMDVIARSITSGIIPLIFAYRLTWESLRCRIV